MEDVNIWTIAYLRCHFVFSATLVANDANDHVFRISGKDSQESILSKSE